MKKSLFGVVAILILIILVFPLYKIATEKKIIIIDNNSTHSAWIETKAPAEEGGRINAIFLGVAGQENNAPNLTDTLIIMSLDNKTKEGFLLSIPRDLFVKMPEKNFYTKINAVYQEGGIESIQKVLEEITGLSFNYNFIIDLEGVKKIIDQVGGININVEYDIYDPNFPGPNNSYQLFILKKGQHTLDGETALKYIRTRHEPTGDFARMSRQQKVLIALKEKFSSLHLLWNIGVIFDILKTLKGHVQTNFNLSLQNIKTSWQIAKNINLEKIKFNVLDPTTNLLVSDHVILGNETAYILKPKVGLDNYSEIKEYINKLIANK